jgi:transcriptional regulator with XRE-family HTH domain
MGKKKKVELTEANVCEYLKRRRETLGISQREMAERLKYRNASFVSMLEGNHVRLPFGKFLTIIKTYELPNDFIFILVKVYHPEFWNLAFQMRQVGFCDGSREEIEERLLEQWNELS